jgi:hypothetical protein
MKQLIEPFPRPLDLPENQQQFEFVKQYSTKHLGSTTKIERHVDSELDIQPLRQLAYMQRIA